MTKEYIADQPYWVQKYYQILNKIASAGTEERLNELEESVEGFYKAFGYKTVGWWVFSWTVENKPVYSAYESLKKQIDIRRDHVYRMNLFENVSEQ
jgi:hypothetical protein